MSEWIAKPQADNRSLPWKAQMAKAAVFQWLKQIQGAGLTWHDESGQSHFFGDRHAPYQGECQVVSPHFYWRLLKDGSIGAGEGYIAKEWESPDLSLLLQVLSLQLPLVDRLEKKWAWLSALSRQILRWHTRNRVGQSKKNIMAHYDVGNEFYQTFLDEHWLYSSALFESDDMTLAEAQIAKMRRLCEQLSLSSQDHVLEIGTGWGAMAIFMAKEYGCRVTTTTISPAQYEEAHRRILLSGVADKITLLQQDYRHLTGQFDKVVSIEMLEAVGEQFLNEFIRLCQMRLKPQGLLALQCIVIDDSRYESYRKNVDFIQKHVFPGGFLPSLSNFLRRCQTHSDFVLRDSHEMGGDYAKTLQCWRAAFEDHWSSYDKLGLDEPFLRLWRFYFCYCEAGFLTKNVRAVQLLLARQSETIGCDLP